MNHFVWPTDGLRAVPGNPRLEPSVHKDLIDSRRQELQQLRDEIVIAIAHRIHDIDAVKRSIGVYPGIGQLLISDSHIQVPWLRDYLGRPLTVAPDAPLPKWKPVKTIPIARMAQQWHLDRINAPTSLNGAGITIGVIDTGYDPMLPDLLPPAFSPTFADYVPGTTPVMQPGPVKAHDMHGSIVCSFLAGQISGVANGASVLVAALPAATMTQNQLMVLVALDWLNIMGCDIITTSMLTGAPGDLPGAVPALDAVDHALGETCGAMKTLVTAAIGNIGAAGDIQHPGSSVHTVGVGAINGSGAVFGSAFGSIANGAFKPDIVAPGYDLQLPMTSTTAITVGGTSFATPIVAGAAALVLEDDPSLKGDPAALMSRLLTLVRPVSGASGYSAGAGLLDLKGIA